MSDIIEEYIKPLYMKANRSALWLKKSKPMVKPIPRANSARWLAQS